MSQPIEMTKHESKHLSGVTLLAVKGSIDSETAPVFERELEALLEQGHHRLVVDLAEVEYISSAGVGIFVGMLQEFRAEESGDIKACRVSKKIMKIFESIGLDDMLEFYDNEEALTEWSAAEEVEEDIDHFDMSVISSEVFSGEDFIIKIEAKEKNNDVVKDYAGRPALDVPEGMVLPNEIGDFQNGVWQGKIKITASGQVALKVVDGKHQGQVAVEIKTPGKTVQFPMRVNCSTCATEIIVKIPEVYRCEKCDETFTVDDWGHIITLKPGSTAKRRKSRYKGIEVKINADVNYLGVLRQMISSICQKEEMDDVTTNAVALAVEEVLLNIIEHGNDFDPWQILRLKIEFQKKQIKIQIRDYGDPFDVTKRKNISVKANIAKGSKRGVGGFLVNQLMDQVKYESLKNYNQLIMIKKYGESDE